MKILDKAYWKAKSAVTRFMYEENGDVNIVSIVVLIGIAVALAIIFRNQIQKLLANMFEAIGGSSDDATKAGTVDNFSGGVK